MNSKLLRRLIYTAVLLFYLLHNDVWFWQNPQLVLGLPISLLYHVLYCLTSAGVMVLLVKYVWPTELESDGEDARER